MPLKILVTAGNTMTMIDKVRGISNIFKGRTGHQIAILMRDAGHDVTVLTSNPESIEGYPFMDGSSFRVVSYRTFDNLRDRMQEYITSENFDLIVHSAAVSDYRPTGTVYVPCDSEELAQYGIPEGYVLLKPVKAAAKISSSYKRLFIETIQTDKLIDKIQTEWGFKGFLVKFKLQVDITDGELIEIACKSRDDSNADLIVANCLEWAKDRAYVIGRDDVAHAVKRNQIADAILRRMQ